MEGPPARQASAIRPRSPRCSTCRPVAAGSGRIATPSPRSASCASTPVSRGLERDPGADAGGVEERPDARPAWQADQRVRGQLLQRERVARGQRVTGRDRGHDRGVEDHAGLDALGRARAERRARQVELAGAHRRQQLVRRRLGERDLHPGCCAWKPAQQLGHEHGRPGGDHPDPQLPAQQARELLDRGAHAAHRGQRARGRTAARPRPPPSTSRAAGAVEQLDAELALEPPHLRPHARLRDQHPLRGAREARLSTTATKYSSCRSSIRRDASSASQLAVVRMRRGGDPEGHDTRRPHPPVRRRRQRRRRRRPRRALRARRRHRLPARPVDAGHDAIRELYTGMLARASRTSNTSSR